MSGGSRTAFQLWPALEHKGKQSVISAIAVDGSAQHIYVGTSDGQLEEHRIHSSYQSVRVSLGARKHIGKKVCIHTWSSWLTLICLLHQCPLSALPETKGKGLRGNGVHAACDSPPSCCGS